MAMDPLDKRRIMRTAAGGAALAALCAAGVATGVLPLAPGLLIGGGITFVFVSMVLRQRQSALARARRRG